MLSQVTITFLRLTLLLSILGQSAAGCATGGIQVRIPGTLTRDGGYDNREALFGNPPYEDILEHIIHYADTDLCGDSYYYVDVPIEALPERRAGGNLALVPYLLMVDRGGCTFVKKVRNAQRSGAIGVIIADRTCLCSAGETCTPKEADDVCELKEPIMADDGSGSDIAIPSFLMFKEDADPIWNLLKHNKTVRMDMTWTPATPKDQVEYDLYTTPTDAISWPFLAQFKAASLALGERAKFTPHMFIYDGIKAGCQGFDGENQCYNLCTNNGRYCAVVDTDDDLVRGISGADVVGESLRRACIWKTYGADGVGEAWWTYVEEFMLHCQGEDFFTSKECINDAYLHAVVDKGEIDACMLNAGGLEGDVTNSVLEAQLGELEASGIVLVPSLVVNCASMQGALDFATVFNAVCAGYEGGPEPAVCQKCAKSLEEFECVTNYKIEGMENGSLSQSESMENGSLSQSEGLKHGSVSPATSGSMLGILAFMLF